MKKFIFTSFLIGLILVALSSLSTIITEEDNREKNGEHDWGETVGDDNLPRGVDWEEGVKEICGKVLDGYFVIGDCWYVDVDTTEIKTPPYHIVNTVNESPKGIQKVQNWWVNGIGTRFGSVLGDERTNQKENSAVSNGWYRTNVTVVFLMDYEVPKYTLTGNSNADSNSNMSGEATGRAESFMEIFSPDADFHAADDDWSGSGDFDLDFKTAAGESDDLLPTIDSTTVIKQGVTVVSHNQGSTGGMTIGQTKMDLASHEARNWGRIKIRGKSPVEECPDIEVEIETPDTLFPEQDVSAKIKIEGVSEDVELDYPQYDGNEQGPFGSGESNNDLE